MAAPEEDGRITAPEEEIGADTHRQEVKVYHKVGMPEVAMVEAPTHSRTRRGNQRGTRRRKSLHSQGSSRRGVPK